MNITDIAHSAATFNAQHDYDIEAALSLTSIILRHAHTVQIARTKAADPQLELPIDLNGEAA